MTLPQLTVIPAGAGSGKTYSLQKRLGAWVVEQRVAPERIVAVTFTEAAAGELRDRIGAELLGHGRVEEALRLDEAYISTIHGFGLRVLTEFAFDARRSPRPRLLEPHEQDSLLRLALARSAQADEIASRLDAYGYRWEFLSGKTPEAAFHADVLRVVGLLRSVGWSRRSDDYALRAAERIAWRYGPCDDAGPLHAELRSRVAALWSRFPQSLAGECPGNKSASDDFARDHANLHRAATTDALAHDWKLWQQLRELRVTAKGMKPPAGYVELASRVMEAANALPRHPGPLAHALRHVSMLLGTGQDVLVRYEEAKREAGLVDYADMIALAAQLLRDRPDVLETLRGRIDCLVVDEFQDTNPLQFALVWQLAASGLPTVLVGDLKQAIMGFQGADPRLFEALQLRYAAQCEPLTYNWRSEPRIMAVVNAVGPGLFGGTYVALEPRGKPSALDPLEIIEFPARPRRDAAAVRAATVGMRIRRMLDDGGQRIVDRRTGFPRRLRGSDFAVLCPTHQTLADYARVLRAQGHRVRLRADGWYASRIVEIARAALSYLANPADRHAALYLAVTELGSHDLKQALEQLIERGRIDDPVLDALVQLAPGVTERTVYTLVVDTIAALGLWDRIAHWPDGEQARANLLRLLAEAGRFMDANREALAHGGFHGGGILTFLSWLATQVELDEGDRQPEPRVLDEDAIELCTWHASKGREWPVVAVCGLERAVEGRLPSLGLGYASFDDLGNVLEHARIEYSPEFAAPETNAAFQAELDAREELEARRQLYVALTRARDKLVLEWPEYVGDKKMTRWSLLADACGCEIARDGFVVSGERFDCRVLAGAAELPESLELDRVPAVESLPRIGRRAIRPGSVPAALTPDSRTPSELATEVATSASTGLVTERYGAALDLHVGLAGVELGSFVHRAFEVLGARPELVERLPDLTGVAADEPGLATIGSAVGAFEAWLARRFPGARVRREWPVLCLDAAGTVVNGTIDLVVETAAGAWILDHKTDAIDDPAVGYARHERQLEAYALALAAGGATIAGTGIHWAKRGEVTLRAVSRP